MKIICRLNLGGNEAPEIGGILTSQVAVMNLRGIAVASDTVLSRTSQAGTKTMGNTGKIYELGAVHKVLILHSANTDLNEVPVSVYIGDWAQTLVAPLPRLNDYVDSFMKWVGRDTLIQGKFSANAVMSAALDEHFGWMQRRCTGIVSSNPSVDGESSAKFSKRIEKLVEVELQSGLDFLGDFELFRGMTDESAAELLATNNYNLDQWIDAFFSEIPLTEKSRDILKLSAPRSVSRAQELSDTDLVLAFVGFGEEEPFGGSIKVTARGIYGGKLRAIVADRFGVAVDDKTGIVHFAQGDAIASFLRGSDWKIQDKYRSLFSAQLRKISEEHAIEIDISSTLDQISSDLADFSHEKFVSPLLSTIEAMGIRSIADFAESLVALQATSSYAKDGPATVGGFIEVATIDRVKGVTWVKALATDTTDRFR